ncbi:MAG: hypothetical protein Q9217_001914 [Psora testacea]
MAKSSTIPRPIILDLAQIIKYPRRRDVFIATLPFKLQDVTPKLAKTIIKRTQKRWKWFSEARKLDDRLGTSLGTLGYLPWEVRQHIFWWFQSIHFSCDADTWIPLPDKDSVWQFHLDRDWTTPVKSKSRQDCEGFDHPSASRSLSTEFDTFLLRHNIMKFQCPAIALEFLDQYSGFPGAPMRRIVIELYDWRCHTDKQHEKLWRLFCSNMPVVICSVQFEVGATYPFPRKEVDHFAELQQYVKPVVALVEVLSKVVRRRLPKASIRMRDTPDWTQLKDEYRDLINAAFSELE